MLSFSAPILADTPAQPQASAGPLGALVSFFPLIAFGLIFYFLLFRPQQKAGQERKKMIEGVKKGDRILTAGGLYGSVVGVRGDVLDVKLAETLKVEVNRNFISRVMPNSQADKTVVNA